MDKAGLCRFLDIPNGLAAEVQFKLVNSGDADGNAVVEMTARNLVVDSKMYFVRAGETQAQKLSFEDHSCLITQAEINVRIARVDGS